MMFRTLVLMSVSIIALAGCAELFPKPHPDATGGMAGGYVAYELLRQLDECEHRAVEAYDGFFLEHRPADIAPHAAVAGKGE